MCSTQDFWSPLQQLFKLTCNDYDARWLKRKRIITTLLLVIFILKLVLSKNRQGYSTLLNELWETTDIFQGQSGPVSASSLCEARQKMPEDIFLRLSDLLVAENEKKGLLPSWYGHRVFAVDGCRINLPRELLHSGYKTQHRNQYYPQGLLSTVYHLGGGMVYDAKMSPSFNERHLLLSHFEKLRRDDVVVLDRGYFSYLILHQALSRGIHLICRIQPGQTNHKIKAFLNSNKEDEIISYEPCYAVRYESRKQGYEIETRPIKLRLIKYIVGNEVYICCTTLLDQSKYPHHIFPPVYRGRWGIEELYKISKSLIDIEDFHSKTERGVKQECFAHILLVNLARTFESQANTQVLLKRQIEKIDNNDRQSYWQDFCGRVKVIKINFKNCLLVIGRNLVKLFTTSSLISNFYLDRILKSIARVREKIRPNRHARRYSRKPTNKWSNCNNGATRRA